MKSELYFNYNGGKRVKVPCVHCLYLGCLCKQILNIQEQIKKYAVENNLYPQSRTSTLECNVLMKTIFILEQIFLIYNVFCRRLKIYYQLLHNAVGLVLLS